MSENKTTPIEWALGIIAAAPPLQNVVAFLIILLLAAPLIRAGWKEFRKVDTPPPVPWAPTAMIQETPWLIQTLTRMEIELEALTKKVDGIDKRLRRRGPPTDSGKTA